ncbi:MAG: hypothetical protein JWQ82_1246 [Tardiphaga sp.]|nr:hypothetical protein [Tardiphaga sp.]
MKDRIREEVFDLDELLHPADAFEHPSEVLHDPDLTLNEKRAILASWASDACALEAAPDLRELPRGRLVLFDDIMDALRSLDHDEAQARRKYRKLVRRRTVFDRPRRSEDSGPTISS